MLQYKSVLLLWMTCTFSIVFGTFLELKSLDEAKEAVCIDGSQASYYHTKVDEKSSKRKNFVIYLEGGGYCHEASLCKWRCGIAPWLCTSNQNLPVKEVHGILSDDPEENGGFSDYYKVDIPYCTGDMYIGRRNASQDTEGQHFKGRDVFDAVIKDLLKETNIAEADNVILGGSSAGGAGVAFNCDHLKSLLPATVTVWCIVDAAFFYPVDGPFHNQSECENIEKVLLLSGQLWNAPEVWEFDLHGTWWRHIQSPLLISTARFDRFGLESYCSDLHNLHELQVWESGLMAMVLRLVADDWNVSLFVPACLRHMMLHDKTLYSQLRVGDHRLSLGDTVQRWVDSHQPQHTVDLCYNHQQPFCNPQCQQSLDDIGEW